VNIRISFKAHAIIGFLFFIGLELYRTKKLFIQANSAQSVSFMVIPTKLNHITIKAKATSLMAGDSIEYPLLVKVKPLFI
jgi:hypothetical protein